MIYISIGGTIPCLTFGAVQFTLLFVNHTFKHGKSVFLAYSVYCNGHVESKSKIFTVNYINFMLSTLSLPC